MRLILIVEGDLSVTVCVNEERLCLESSASICDDGGSKHGVRLRFLQGEEPDDGKHRLYRRGSRKASLRLPPTPSPSDNPQEARLPDAAAVEAMLAIALLR